MRLIDADVLINKLNELGWIDETPLDEIINDQPTAYDIKKVMAELETEKCKTVTYKDKYAQGWNNGTANAIYIVRKGCTE